MKYLVVRIPSLMEDGGRYTIAGQADTKKEAQELIKKLDEEGDGFFRGCYRIYKPD